jgi:hypothetical protein
VPGLPALQLGPFLASAVIWVCFVSDLLACWSVGYATSPNTQWKMIWSLWEGSQMTFLYKWQCDIFHEDHDNAGWRNKDLDLLVATTVKWPLQQLCLVSCSSLFALHHSYGESNHFAFSMWKIYFLFL